MADRPAAFLDRDHRGWQRPESLHCGTEIKPGEAYHSSPVPLIDTFSLSKFVSEVRVGSKPLCIAKANASSKKRRHFVRFAPSSGGWLGCCWGPLPGEKYSMSEHEPALARKALDRPRWTGRSAVASPHGGAPWKRPPARAFW